MYNRYLDHMPTAEASHTVPFQREAAPTPPPPKQEVPKPSHKSSALLGEITGGLGDLLGGVLKNFSLENFDTGDILLVLIILFLFLEGDNLEIVITLGLMLLLGLGDD